MAHRPVINGIVNTRRPGDVEKFCRDAAFALDQPIVSAVATVGVQTGGTRPVAIQVRDRVREAWQETWVVLVYIATAPGGAPGGTQTVTFTVGTVLQTITANKAWVVATDENGVIGLDVTAASGQSRVIGTVVLDRLEQTDPAVWA